MRGIKHAIFPCSCMTLLNDYFHWMLLFLLCLPETWVSVVMLLPPQQLIWGFSADPFQLFS